MLIKMRQAPHKHVLKKTLSLTAVNRVIPLATKSAQVERIRELEEQIAHARIMISAFLNERANIGRRSSLRGEERAEKRLITEAFVALANLLKSLPTEAGTIDRLAVDIAASITSVADPAEIVQLPPAEVALKKAIHVIIEAPPPVLEEISLLAADLSRQLELTIETKTGPSDSAQLNIIIGPETCSYSVTPHGMISTLKNVNKRLMPV